MHPPRPWRVAITDPARQGWLERAEHLLRGSQVSFVQLRAHGAAPGDFALWAQRLAAIDARRLILNGPPELARRLGTCLHLRSGADNPRTAVHVFQACHTLAAVRGAAMNGVHTAVVSPVFSPRSKEGDTRAALGVDGLREICAAASLPVLALGGMDLRRHEACVQAGAAGSAAIHWYFGDLPLVDTPQPPA